MYFHLNQQCPHSRDKRRWLFIVEGAASIGIAFLLWLGMPDSYENAKFLNDEDKEICRLRAIKHDRYMRLNESFDKKEVIKAFKDKKIWISASIQFFGDILSFGVSTFMPSLVRSFGFDSVITQLLIAPIFFVGVAIYIAVSFWSDHVQKRAVFMVPGALVVAVGYAMLCGIPMNQRGALYFACFLVVPGIYVSPSAVNKILDADRYVGDARPQLRVDAEQPRRLLQARYCHRDQHDDRKLRWLGHWADIQEHDAGWSVPRGYRHLPGCCIGVRGAHNVSLLL
jgi:hypothetical protein